MKNKNTDQEKISHLETLYGIIDRAVFTDGLNQNEIDVKNSELKRIKKELEYLRSDKTWNFNFEGGGWNSVRAKTKEEAIKKAHESGYFGAIDSTFIIATEEHTKSLLSLFY